MVLQMVLHMIAEDVISDSDSTAMVMVTALRYSQQLSSAHKC